jgi:thiol-disulfide isomerase/thioredoxin
MITSILASILINQSNTLNNPDPSQVLKQIAQVRETAKEAQKRGELFDQGKIIAEQKRIADEALAQIKIDATTPDECVQWARVCGFTDRNDLAVIFSRKAYGARTWDLLELERPLLIDELLTGQIEAAIARVRNINFSAGPAMIGQFHLGVKSAMAKAGAENPEGVTKVYDELIARVHFDSQLSENDHRWAPLVYAELNSCKFSILYGAGQEKEALASLKELQTQMAAYPNSTDSTGKSATDYVASTIAKLTQSDTHGMMLNRPAPPLVYDREIGGFNGAESMKGKVVLLDFMAHWCGPCKAALPDLIKLNERFGSKDLQTVSLTGYYGYYGNKQDLSPELEYAEMKSFVKEFKMDWPVIFDATQMNNRLYGITGIPQLVVIDRKGMVRKIEVGYTPESFKDTIRLVEKLVAEPSN